MSLPTSLHLAARASRDTTLAAAIGIVRELAEAGYRGLFAGGCVRDWLLDGAPADIDIATNATPAEIRGVFPRAFAVGESFGVMLLRRGATGTHEGTVFEIATFRKDLAYLDGRRPEGVDLIDSPEADAARRDFTINGMFYDPLVEQVLDFVGGLADLRSRTIRAIGDPAARFAEDHLRLLRAVRFAARLGFSLDPGTWAAMSTAAPQIQRIASERVKGELDRTLLGPHPGRALELLRDAGLLHQTLPPVAELPDAAFARTVAMLTQMAADTQRVLAGHTDPGAIPASRPLAWAVVLHSLGSPEGTGVNSDGAEGVRRIAAQLRFSTDERRRVVALVADLPRFPGPPTVELASRKRFLRRPGIDEHIALHRLRCLAIGGPLDQVTRAITEIRRFRAGDPQRGLTPQPLLTGTDLKSIGYRPGPAFKEILAWLEEKQLAEQLTSRDAAVAAIRDHFGPPSDGHDQPHSDDAD